MIYNELVESYFFNPKHVGTLDLTHPGAVHHRQGEVSKGNVLDLYLMPTEGKISKACFKAYGNPYMIAAAEWLCRHLEGTLISSHPSFKGEEVKLALAIPNHYYSVVIQIEECYRQIVFKLK